MKFAKSFKEKPSPQYSLIKDKVKSSFDVKASKFSSKYLSMKLPLFALTSKTEITSLNSGYFSFNSSSE